MSKIRSIAERLRSDNPNERAIAAQKISAQSGKSLKEIIRRGVQIKVTQPSQKWFMAHLMAKEGDDLIVAITCELVRHPVSWGDLVESGLKAIEEPRPASFADANYRMPKAEVFTKSDIFAAHREAARRSFRESQSTDAFGTRTKERPDIKLDNFVRMGALDLPEKATGIPYIVHMSVTRDRQAYVIVRFHRMTVENGARIAPMCDFIAFGDEWVGILRKAENKRESVKVRFGNDRTPGKAVIIRQAAE